MPHKSLLEVAMAQDAARRNRVTDEQFDLTLAYLRGECSASAVGRALGCKSPGAVWHRLFQYMVAAYRKGWLVVAKPEQEDTREEV